MAAGLLQTLGDLKRDDADLARAATTETQRAAVSAARARSYALRRAIQRRLSGEVSVQRLPLPLGDDY